ncbi:hypothetical protein Tco_0741524 [Tanacetum coccineum]
MTMHEVVHEMVVEECYEPNSEGSGSALKAYMNARVAGLFLLVLLEYPNGVHECEGCWFIPVGLVGVHQRQDETSETLSYAGWMAGPYRAEDATRGRNDDPVTSGIRASSQYRIRWKQEGVMDESKWWMTVVARWILSRQKE